MKAGSKRRRTQVEIEMQKDEEEEKVHQADRIEELEKQLLKVTAEAENNKNATDILS